MNPRTLIITAFKSSGVPIELNKLKAKHARELSQINFRNFPLIDDMAGLSPEEAQRLVEFYGAGFLFSKSIEAMLTDYFETKEKIKSIENKRNK